MKSLEKDWVYKCRCGATVKRSQIVRQRLHRQRSIGDNMFSWSKYQSSFWTCTAADAGSISQTDSSFNFHVARDTTITEKGTQTWTGDGTMTSNAVDCSAKTMVVFRVRIGPYQQNDDHTLNVALAAKNGANVYAIKAARDYVGANFVWGLLTLSTVTEAHRSALQFYVTVTTPNGTEKWWVTNMSLESEVTEPTVYLEAKGSAVSVTSPTRTKSIGEVCPACREKKLVIDRSYEHRHDDKPELAEDLEYDDV